MTNLDLNSLSPEQQEHYRAVLAAPTKPVRPKLISKLSWFLMNSRDRRFFSNLDRLVAERIKEIKES